MKVAYFPGCTLKTKAKDLDKYARKCTEVLGVTLEEIEAMEKWEGSELNKAKEILAFELTQLVHGTEEANKAKEAAEARLKEMLGDLYESYKKAENLFLTPPKLRQKNPALKKVKFTNAWRLI